MKIKRKITKTGKAIKITQSLNREDAKQFQYPILEGSLGEKVVYRAFNRKTATTKITREYHSRKRSFRSQKYDGKNALPKI